MFPEQNDVPDYLRHKQDGQVQSSLNSDRLLATAPPALLVVEDDPLLRELIAAILEHHGYQVYDAANGREALAILARCSAIDMLLLDFELPGMNGRAVAEAARRLRPGIPVLFVTGHGAAAELGGEPENCVLQKPFRDDVLAERVRRMMPERAVRLGGPPDMDYRFRLRA